MKFKTNIEGREAASAVMDKIRERFPNSRFELDLENADKVLEVHGVPEDSENAAIIERNIEEAGFRGAWMERGINNK